MLHQVKIISKAAPEITEFSKIIKNITVLIDSGFLLMTKGRFFPQNVSATRMVAKIYSPSRNSTIGKQQEPAITLDTPVYFPVFNVLLLLFKAKINVSKSELKLDSVLLISLYTCDRYSCNVLQLGCACFAMFVATLDEDGQETIETRIRTGSFQIPILAAEPKREQMLDPLVLTSLPRFTLL